MIKITITNLEGGVELMGEPSRTLLQIIQEHRLDWMHACGAKGRCTTCKVVIEEGEEHLSLPTGPERRFQSSGALTTGERLTCQSRTKGNLKVRVPRESMLPHVNYSD